MLGSVADISGSSMRPSISRKNVSFPENLRNQPSGSRRPPPKKSQTLPPRIRSPLLTERSWSKLPVLEEDSKEDRASPITELGVLREFASPDPSASTMSSTLGSPALSISSATTSVDFGDPSTPAILETKPCCTTHGLSAFLISPS